MSNPQPNVDVPEVFTPPSPEICVRMARQQIALAQEHLAGVPDTWWKQEMDRIVSNLALAEQAAEHVLKLYPDGGTPAELNLEDEGTLGPWPG